MEQWHFVNKYGDHIWDPVGSVIGISAALYYLTGHGKASENAAFALIHVFL